MELFKYPYEFGEYKGSPIEINNGKFGLYFKYKGKNYSLKDFEEPQTIEDFDDYFKAQEERKTISSSNSGGKSVEGLPRKISDKIWIKSGKYGPYIQYKKTPLSDAKPKFISIGKADPIKITEKECLALINKNKK